MSETKAAFAERERERERESISVFKTYKYPYTEEHGEKIVPKLQKFVSSLNFVFCTKNHS